MLRFMSFRAPPAALKQKKLHNATNMQPNMIFFHGTSHFGNLFKIIERVVSLL